MTEGPYAAVADSMEGAEGAVPAQAPVPLTAESVPDRLTPVRFLTGYRHRVVALAGTELVVAALAMYLATLVRFGAMEGQEFAGPIWVHMALAAAAAGVSIVAMGLYHLGHRAGFAGVAARLLIAVICAQVVLAVVSYVLPQLAVGRGVMILSALFAFIGLATTRLVYLRFVDEEIFKRRVFVWGAGARAASIANRLRRRSDRRGFKIVGYFNSPGDVPQVPHAINASPDTELLRYVLRERIDEIVVAMDDRRRGFPEALLRQCRLRGIQVRDVVTFIERESGYVSVELAPPSWLIFSEGFRCDLLRVAVKRGFDLAASLAVLILSAPIALLAVLAIFAEDRGPILYRQVRVGQHGRTFNILKFRSMSVNAESGGKAVWAAKNDSRVTRVGAFIRRTRIDEIPQAINVLLGDMSFVGPRPERPQFVEQLSRNIPYYAERHFVKPGITGWAQVRFPYGASEADAKEKLGYDLYYVKNHSLLFDVAVLLQTVEVILFRVGSR